MSWIGRAIALAVLLSIGCGLAACGYEDPNQEPVDTDYRRQRYDPLYGQSVFGEGGLQIFGGESSDTKEAARSGIGVNSFLWRASLDTISFMPLSSADPFGGVIITDWYSPPDTPDERFKMTVYILDRVLRADGLKVAVFRQQRTGDSWVDSPTDPSTATSLENKILERARQLRSGRSSE